jgi:hypothetical protein
MRRGFVAFLVVCATCVACVSDTHTAVNVSMPPELMVPQGATDVKAQPRGDGGVELHYRLEQSFPAESLLTNIHSALPLDRWRPLTKEWLNPNADTSNATGWTNAAITVKNTEKIVHSWNGEWLDSNDNLVMYFLRYESRYVLSEAALQRPDNFDLSVTALWIPTSAARAMRQNLNRGQR